MINDIIKVNNILVFNPWRHYSDGGWVRYMRNHWVNEITVNTRIVIYLNPQLIDFCGITKQISKYYDFNKLYNNVEDAKENIDQFLIKISKLKLFV